MRTTMMLQVSPDYHDGCHALSLSAFINRDPNVQGRQLANRHRLLDCYEMQCVFIVGGFYSCISQP